MQKLNYHISELQLFRFFRIFFGLFLFFHFFFLFGHMQVLFSKNYLAVNYAGAFNILSYIEDGWILNLVNLTACLLGLAVSFNFHRQISSLVLIYINACYLHKNPMILNVSYDYLGWMLLALVLIPNENTSVDSKRWCIPNYILIGSWLLFGLGYTLNGILKFKSPFWIDGTALSFIIPNDRLLANEMIRQTLMSFPLWLTKSLTWMTAGAELLCLPFIFFKSTRQIIWFVILALHMNALLIFKIKDLSLIMIFFSFFIGIGLARNISAVDFFNIPFKIPGPNQ